MISGFPPRTETEGRKAEEEEEEEEERRRHAMASSSQQEQQQQKQQQQKHQQQQHKQRWRSSVAIHNLAGTRTSCDQRTRHEDQGLNLSSFISSITSSDLVSGISSPFLPSLKFVLFMFSCRFEEDYS